MKKRSNIYLYVLFFCVLGLFSPQKTNANHLVGGELTYECLGGDLYQVGLAIYRDCYSDGAPFDDPAAIYIQDSNGDYLEFNGNFRIPMFLSNTDTSLVPINDDDLCTDDIPDVCVSKATYNTTISLPPDIGGYDIIYQRCCRNTSIVNIAFPGETGSTYKLHIPHETANCNNNSPNFNNFPPVVICDGFPIQFDHSASDADGDSLVYELCRPLSGAEAECPGNPLFNNAGSYIAPNFSCCNFGPQIDYVPCQSGVVGWLPSFSTDNPLGNPNDPLSIDPVTGILTGTPAGVGQYVVGICVSEYRNGVLLSQKTRDFQFNVTDCDLIRATPTTTESGIVGNPIINAPTIEIAPGVYQVTHCTDFSIAFANQSVGATSFEWDFGVEGIDTDVSTEPEPIYMFPDTGVYNIQLIAYNGTACVDTSELILNLYPAFNSNFIYDSSKCQDESFTFTDQTTSSYGIIDSWTWDFGDGTIIGPGTGGISTSNTTGTYTNLQHIFAEPGNYEVVLYVTNDFGCKDSIAKEVEVLAVPNVNIDFDFLCLDVPVNFTGISDLNNITNWDWSFDLGPTNTGQTQQQLYNSPGDYSAMLTVTTTDGCDNDTLLPFTIYPQTFADAGLDTIMCLLTEIQLDASASVGGAGTNNTYQWEPAEFVTDDAQLVNPTISPPADQVFTVYVADPNGCTDSSDVFIEVLPLPSLDAGEDITDLCLGDSAQLNASIAPEVINFTWSPTQFMSNDGILTPFVNPTDTISYQLSVIDNNTCENTDSVIVSVIPPVNPMIIRDGGTICEDDTIQLEVSGGQAFEWFPDLYLSDNNIPNPVVQASESITYTVYISNPPCFIDSVNIDVTVLPKPFVDAGSDSVTVNIGEFVELNGMGEVDYQWTPELGLSASDIPNPEAQPLQTTTYTLTTTSENGCKASDSIKVAVENNFNIIIPTAFSPNGDGRNDDIGIITLGVEEISEFAIFNRWGEKVFSTNNKDERWDGTFRGKPVTMGVYVYFVKGTKYLGGEIMIQGNITIIR